MPKDKTQTLDIKRREFLKPKKSKTKLHFILTSYQFLIEL